MNFGGKIVILYISFVALIVTLVTLCYKQDVELVSDDYYAQEIRFQEKINASNNANRSESTIGHVVTDNEIVFTADSALLSKDFKGTITLFRPSDSKLDLTYTMNFVNSEQVISKSVLVKGVYKLQLAWMSDHIPYFKEEVIFIK
jgi:hypothetical protein